MRIIQVEAPVNQNLRLYLYPFGPEISADSAGYPLTETSPRLYEATIPDDTLIGVYRGVVELQSSEITAVIDSGYVTLCSGDGNFILSNKGPTCDTSISTPSPEEPALTLTDNGPKRVKTKEMEIEQFDPLRNQMANDRQELKIPTWCNGPICVGRGIRE